MAYNLSEHEMKIFLDNVDINKFYQERREYTNVKGVIVRTAYNYYRMSDDTLCFSRIASYDYDNDKHTTQYLIHSEPTESELKEPTPRLVLTPKNLGRISSNN